MTWLLVVQPSWAAFGAGDRVSLRASGSVVDAKVVRANPVDLHVDTDTAVDPDLTWSIDFVVVPESTSTVPSELDSVSQCDLFG